MPFASVVGHERARGLLARMLSADRLPPALLFSGPEGVGKRTLALALARAVVCEAEVGKAQRPCDACRSCRRVLRALEALPALRQDAEANPDEPDRRNYVLHPDVILVEARQTAVRLDISIKQIRALVRAVAGLPYEARARVFVVDDAHALTEAAANAFLKSLEEPPSTSHIVLVTSQPQGLLSTIRSRCQQVGFGALTVPTVESWLRERAGLDATEAGMRAMLSEGSLGAALAMEGEAYRTGREEWLALLESGGPSGTTDRLEAAGRLAARDDLALSLRWLRSLLRDVAVTRAGAPPEQLMNRDVLDRIAGLAAGPLGARAADLAAAVEETRRAVRGNANKLLAMDALLDALEGR